MGDERMAGEVDGGPAVSELVESVIRRMCGIPVEGVLPSDAPLWELGMDSLRVVELVMLLEDELDLTFPEEHLTTETFATVDSTLAVVRELMP